MAKLMNLHKLSKRVVSYLFSIRLDNFCIFKNERKENMKFVEAFELLKSGKAVARESWNETGEYLLWLYGAEHMFKVSRIPNTSGAGYAFTFKDLDADDWKEVTKEEMVAFVPKVAA
jgi:hypothetical protein